MRPSRRDVIIGSSLALTGLAVWLVICAVSHRREAWDARLYWSSGLPLMALASAAAGWLAPQRPWRWGLLIMAPQPLVLFIQNPSGGMLPLGLIVFLVLSLPCILAALLGSWLGRLVSKSKSAD